MKEPKAYRGIAFALAYGMNPVSLQEVLKRQKNVSLVQIDYELAKFKLRMKSQPSKGTHK